MAFQEENSNQNNQQQARPAGAQASSQANNEPSKPKTWDFHQDGFMDIPVAAGVGGEYLINFRNALMEIFKEIAPTVNLKVLTLNRANLHQLRFSALVVACSLEDHKGVAAFHTLLLEATGEKLAPVIRQINNQPIRVNRVTSDAYDDVLFQLATEAVTEAFPGDLAISAEGMVVPATVRVESPDGQRREQMINIARNAAMACVSRLYSATDSFQKLNLAFMDRDVRFLIDVAFGNHQVYDIVGNPQRSSVLVSYSSQKKSNQSISGMDTVNVPESTTRLCEVSGFLNTVWAYSGGPSNYGFGGYRNNAPEPTQRFAAEFVMTSVRARRATSPAAILLGMSSVLALVDNDNWLQNFLSRPSQNTNVGQSRVDITDIGALNITANLNRETDKGGFGTPIEISLQKNDLAEINQYLVTLFHPGIILSVDCPEVGPESWALSVFAAAASGDPDALDQIYQAAMELTNGLFEQYFKPNTPMFTSIMRVPNGHYTLNGELQDIRNIDYVAICNLYANNPQMIHNYAMTFADDRGANQLAALAERETIISHALQEKCEITGYSSRVTLSNEFVMALSQSFAALNLPTIVNTPLNADQLRVGVSAPSFVNNSLTHNTRTFGGGYTGVRTGQQYGVRGRR